MAQEDLTLVGLTDDGKRLLLVDDAGKEYTVASDAKLRAALRGEHARLGQLEIQMDSALRPRDIQARIRAGESPETVAVAAKTTVDKIMVFATPVLAERAHVAQRAQRSSIRRKAGDGPARSLGEATEERLRSRNVDPTTVEWDAWRRQDGRWTLVADYLSGESSRHAEFMFDVPGSFVIAENDEARWLVGEETSLKGPQPRVGGTPRRLSAVSNESELPLGDDAIGMISEPSDASVQSAPGPGAQAAPAEPSPQESFAEDEHTVDLTEAAETLRASAGEAAAQEDSGDRSAEEPATAAADSDEGERPDGAGDTPATNKPAKKSRGRASIPSWDEIMFGGGKSD